ncbi:hypothetical protein M117_3589 [Bacteroides fragilis str. 3774 T13]|nr:hypothetical protein M117_3589 [Bacteroides fragilis str. 3774 T13]
MCNECAATRSFTFLGILWDVLVPPLTMIKESRFSEEKSLIFY